MTEYFGIKGNVHYIINQDFDEAYTFNNFGEGISRVLVREALLEIYKNKIEVDVISVLGETGSNVCEVFFKGSPITIEKGYLDVYSILSKRIKRVNHLVYRLKHDRTVSQILFVVNKDSVSQQELEAILN